MSQPSLPAGWAAQWDAQANRYLFVDTINNRSQWEQPTGPAIGVGGPGTNGIGPGSSSTPVPQTNAQQQQPVASSNPRRRQYPTAQMAQAYAEGGATAATGGPGTGYGAAIGGGGVSTPGVSGGYSDLAQGQSGQYPQMQVPQNQGPAQLFTPGAALAGGQPQGGAGGYLAPANPGYADQKAFSVAGGVDPNQQQQQGGVGGMMGNMVNQFSNMGMGGGQNPGYAQGQTHQSMNMPMGGQGHASHSHPLINLNLIGLQPSVPDLARDPPVPLLPQGACISNNPAANAHHSYQRSTINAIPTTASLLNKTKIPLALILTPYRSVQEGDVSRGQAGCCDGRRSLELV
jgi:protein transport protein SEC24